MSGLRFSRRYYWTPSVPICSSPVVRRLVTIYWPITEYDLYYIKNRSLALDLQILLQTIGVMLTLKGT
jgi:hypothetical protein